MQRGLVMTFPASVKSSRERVGGSEILAKSDGDRNSLGFWAVAALISPRRRSFNKKPPRSGAAFTRVSSARVYLRAAQAYMLISMPTGNSTIFGVFQDI
jgi:hypothetical protein